MKKILLIILAVIIVLIGLFGLFVFNPFEAVPAETNVAIPVFQDPNCLREFSPSFNVEPYYDGLLFDSHFHLPPTFAHQNFPVLEETITLNEVICQLEKEKVIGTFAFYFPNFWMMIDEEQTEEQVFNKWTVEMEKIKAGAPDWLHLFFIPGPLSAEQVAQVYNLNSDIFEGFGEIVYFFPEAPRLGSNPDDAISLGIDKIAEENNLIVMLHAYSGDVAMFQVFEGQKDNLEKALQQYPEVKFIIHGWENMGYTWDFIERYPNLYFTVDAAVLYPIFGMINGSGEDFIPAFKKDFTSILDEDVARWKPIIEKFPDRFMWGTDRSVDFHYTEEMSLLQEEFARAFIGRLDPAVQENFAYKNAQNLLQN